MVKDIADALEESVETIQAIAQKVKEEGEGV